MFSLQLDAKKMLRNVPMAANIYCIAQNMMFYLYNFSVKYFISKDFINSFFSIIMMNIQIQF